MKYRNSKSTLFLMELIIAILFFAVTSAVCAQIFAKSHILSTKTTRLNHAVAQAESAAESFKAVNGSMEDLTALFPGAALDKNTLTVFYDSDWQPDSMHSVYVLTMTRLADDGHCVRARIEVTAAGDNDIIYALDIQKYVKGQ